MFDRVQNYDILYKFGDYIFVDLSIYSKYFNLDDDDLHINDSGDDFYIVPAKIVQIVDGKKDFPYIIELINGEFPPEISETDIKRKMTIDEIVRFNIKKYTIKYNL